MIVGELTKQSGTITQNVKNLAQLNKNIYIISPYKIVH